MKKIILLSFSFFWFSQILLSQIDIFKLGIEIAPSFTKISTNDNLINPNGSNLGLKVGPIGEFSFSPGISLQTGLKLNFNYGGNLHYEIGGNYLPKSNLTNENLNSGDKPLPDGINIRYKLEYLEIPILMKIGTNSNNNMRFYGMPGISWALKTQSRGNLKGRNINTPDQNIKKDVSSFLIFWSIDGGFERILPSGTIIFGALSFQRSINDITENNGVTARLISGGETPTVEDDIFDLDNEDSKASLGIFALKFGFLF